MKIIKTILGNLKEEGFKESSDRDFIIQSFLTDAKALVNKNEGFKIEELDDKIVFSIILNEEQILVIHNKKTNETKKIPIINSDIDYDKYNNSDNYELSVEFKQYDDPIQYQYIVLI